MLVVDTSAVVELVLRTPIGTRVITEIGDHSLHAPDLIGVEIVSVLRRLVAIGELSADTARRAIVDVLDLGVAVYEHAPLLGRMFDLRDNMTAYDAAYISLAEGLGATLITCDAKLAKAPGHRATVELVPA